MAADWHMHREDGQAVVEVIGELDLANGPALGRAIETELLGDHIDTLVVDLRRLSFMDSSGINSLLGLRRELEEHDVTMELVVGPGSMVARVLHVTGLDSLFVVRSDGSGDGATGRPHHT